MSNPSELHTAPERPGASARTVESSRPARLAPSGSDLSSDIRPHDLLSDPNAWRRSHPAWELLPICFCLEKPLRAFKPLMKSLSRRAPGFMIWLLIQSTLWGTCSKSSRVCSCSFAKLFSSGVSSFMTSAMVLGPQVEIPLSQVEALFRGLSLHMLRPRRLQRGELALHLQRKRS